MAPSWITSWVGQTTVTCRTTNKSSRAAHLSFFLPEQDLEHIFYQWMIESAWAINKNRVNLMDCLVDVLQLAPGLQAICSWCKNGTASCFLMFAWHTSCYRCIKLICLTLHSILVISWYHESPFARWLLVRSLKMRDILAYKFFVGRCPKNFILCGISEVIRSKRALTCSSNALYVLRLLLVLALSTKCRHNCAH